MRLFAATSTLVAFCCSMNALGLAPRGAGEGKRVDFEKDVRPIFAANCYQCHGPDKQKGQLRLDSREIALQGGISGNAAVKPGEPDGSYLLTRIKGEGDEERMPLEHPPLAVDQIATIQAWIEQGAQWPDRATVKDAKISRHWAFDKPVCPKPPATRDAKWARNSIDQFILARLEKEGLRPSPEADRVTLARRLYLDLIGLPPTPREVDEFVNDRSADAYEKLVDRLLASPHYGERWGRLWLDIARYADTNGYEKDRPRTIWPYRDWVINAINVDMPFDQFTIEQIAGDMLPGATPEQIIATGFHRNTMTNEEGGIDVEEFRVKNVVDRVHTTATAWLGLTVQCAQCHNHKYDPISQKDYYRLFALLNNADEPHEYKIPVPEIVAERERIEKQIAELESRLEESFPAGEQSAVEWTVLEPVNATAVSGATLTPKPDHSLLAGGPVPETDSYTVDFRTDLKDITAIRLEAMTDPSLTATGPGRLGADNGNFVVTELRVSAAPAGGGEAQAVALQNPQADVAQNGFAPAALIDGNPGTGWAVDDGSGKLNQNHTVTFSTADPVGFDGGTVLTVTIDQDYARHTLGRFRVSAGRAPATAPDEAVTGGREKHFQQKLAEWEQQTAAKAGKWQAIRPTRAVSEKGATMTYLDDDSVLVGGDWPNNDTYQVDLNVPLDRITAIRLEVLPHESHPDGGPGRAPLFSVGDFLLSEIACHVLPPGKAGKMREVKFTSASHSAASDGKSAEAALDGRVDTGWSVGASTARPANAVFVLGEPIAKEGGSKLRLTLTQQYIHQMCIGRFRIWATADEKPAPASNLPPEVEAVLVNAPAKRTDAQREVLKRHFLSVTPELSPIHQQIASLRQSMPKFPTTLAMHERQPEHRRTTRLYHRGEFLHPRDPVEPGVPSVLHPLPKGEQPDRLALAKWLVSKENPLVGRVVMNRAWFAFFGRGIVPTVEDFGTMGELPSHPELLDWLATELPRRKWSMKAMHRLIVTSSTYRQSSKVTPKLLEKDPNNVLLARGPRFRIEAEMIRDVALTAAGLLDRRIGGPSVYPPQPQGVSELSWGATPWPTSTGGDRFRRGIYTYLKRTAPHPGLTIFDGTSADTTCVRRIRSNTPLQALTLLNDQVFVEASQALARRVVTEGPADVAGRMRLAFRLCVAREPDEQELEQATAFYTEQLETFSQPGSDPAAVATSEAIPAPPQANLPELAAWTAVARALLNLDETVSRE